MGRGKGQSLGTAQEVTLSIVLRSAAQLEFDGAIDWYEARSVGLGHRFESAIQATLDAIAAAPFAHAKVLEDVREALVPKFPFCIYYRVEASRIVVISIFHTSRDSSVWQARV